MPYFSLKLRFNRIEKAINLIDKYTPETSLLKNIKNKRNKNEYKKLL